MLSILSKLFYHLKAQAPTAEAYDTLTLQINTNFQKVFDHFSEHQESSSLAPIKRFSAASGGEGPRRRNQPWKPIFEFLLRDEGSDDDVKVLSHDGNDSDEEDFYVRNGVVGLPAPWKYLANVLTEEERRIWLVVNWPSTPADFLKRSIEEAKVKSKLTVDAFPATTSMLPLVSPPNIAPIGEGSPLRKADDIPEEPLPNSHLKFAIDENMKKVLSVLNKVKIRLVPR